MKRVALLIAAVVVAAGAAVIAIGAFLPRSHRVATEISVERPAQDVWSVVRDLGSMPRWCPDVQASSRAPDENGHERWRQKVGGFEVVLEVVQVEPAKLLSTRLLGPERAAFGGRWIYELVPQADGKATRVRLTEDGWIGPWPFRTLAWGFGYHTSIDRCMAGLAHALGSRAAPVHVEPAPTGFRATP